MTHLRKRNQTWRNYCRALIAENKWRAVRDGIDGKLLDWGKELEVPVRFLIEEWLELLDDVVDQLDTREEIEYVWTIHREGTSADRRLREYEETGSLNSVVDMLAEETLLGV